MPLYEYACASCHHRFEILQRMGDGMQGLSCPNCGHADLARQLSTFAAATAADGVPARRAADSAPCGTGCGCAWPNAVN